MNVKYSQIISGARESGGLLDSMLAIQSVDGYLSTEAMEALAAEFGLSPAEIFDTASFYSMIKFEPQSKVDIQICRGAPCHVAGAAEVIAALEKALGIEMGSSTPDGKYSLRYTECIGQCQASPSLLINGKLYTEMTAVKVRELSKGGLEG